MSNRDLPDVKDAGPTDLVVGAEVAATYRFTDNNIRDYATLAVDTNPLHHDADLAKRSRFGALICCASHSTGIFTSLTAVAFSGDGRTVGLEFTHTLRRAVRTGTMARMIWRVVEREPSSKLGGYIFHLEGEMTDESGRPLIKSVGRLLRFAE